MTIFMDRVRCGRYWIELAKGDITEFEVDAIVNAANRFLKHGGGVAGAIVRKGGYIIQKESDELIRKRGPLNVGDAVYTSGGNLKAKIVIHTVGPIYGEGDEYSKIYKAVWNSVSLADENGMRSVAFPAISTGVYRVPPDISARAMIQSLIDYSKYVKNVERVIIVLYTDEIFQIFRDIFNELTVQCR